MNRPLALVCFICGRQFGTKSLSIHIKTCQKKWENQENLKPPKQRRQCPQPPPGFLQLISKQNITKKDIIEYNTGSFNTYMEQALVQCEICGRKFNQKSLVPHLKACKISPMIRKPYTSKQQKPILQPKKIENNFNENIQDKNVYSQLIPCGKCGRKFAPDRVDKHQKVCKQTKKQPVKVQTKVQQTKNLKPTMFKKNVQSQQIGKQAKWKVQHNQLQQAMKAMRQLKKFQQNGGDIRDLPPPPKSNYDHYIQCKYCGRKYAPQVAERHIPKCANIINKPGGIKTSKIQEKYVAGTGVKKGKDENPYSKVQVTKSNIFKPALKPTSVKQSGSKFVGKYK